MTSEHFPLKDCDTTPPSSPSQEDAVKARFLIPDVYLSKKKVIVLAVVIIVLILLIIILAAFLGHANAKLSRGKCCSSPKIFKNACLYE
jgi:uncharacterized membrane protein YvbJ